MFLLSKISPFPNFVNLENLVIWYCLPSLKKFR
jgi:hypothetical protein